MAAKAATKTATESTAPAKAPRVRKPKLVPAPANAEEVALAKITSATTTSPLPPGFGELSPVDFLLKPHLQLQLGEGGELTLTPFDAAAVGKKLYGTSVSVEVLPGRMPAYRLDRPNTLDLRFLLANHVKPTLQAEAESLTAITISDLERSLKSSEGQAEVLAEAVNDLRDKLAEARMERDHADRAADSSAVQVTHLQEEIRTVKESGIVKVREDAATIADLRRSLGDARNQASTYGRQSDEAHAQFPVLQRQFNEIERQLIEKTEELRLLEGKVANDRWHVSRTQAEVIRRKRLTFWQRVRQVFRPDGFNGSNEHQALQRIRLDMLDEPEADALRGIPSSEGDLGILAHNRIKSRGAM